MKRRNRVLLLVLCSLLLLNCAVPAHAIAAAVVLNHDELTLYIGETQTMKMYVGNGTIQPKGWSSSRKSVASISKKGVITAKKAGTAVITCKTGYGYNLTCKVTVKKRIEVSGYLNKSYKKLVKKVPAAKKLSAYEDPAGQGNVYVFSDNSGTAPFFRYNTGNNKISFLQISDLTAASDQKGLSLYGVSLGMKQAAAKKALKAKKCTYQSKNSYSAGRTDLMYRKSGHTIRVTLTNGIVSGMQWQR